jgi:crotonobetainyl-CoA:carnitine CoA-transferase CaiB-like acyl-CoA transferase
MIALRLLGLETLRDAQIPVTSVSHITCRHQALQFYERPEKYSRMTGPLDGIHVIEICSAISGPFAAKLLGDMGAEVVKIESPGSGAADRVRNLPYDTHNGSFTWRFLNYNTSKESVTLDLKDEAGKEVFERLVSEADVCLENMRPGSMERLGFGWETLHETNPSLVYCSIKGYGRVGPSKAMSALDTLIQGISGFATQVGTDDRPETMEVLVIDMMTGLYAAWSTAVALVERAGSREGQRIDVSMLDTAVSMLGHQLAEYTGAVHSQEYEPEYGPVFVPNGYFEARDGYLGLLVLDDHWAGFCDAINRPTWAENGHRYATNEARLEHRDELREDIETILVERSVKEWSDRFDVHETTIPAAPVNDIEEMIEDPQVRAQEAVIEREHPILGSYYTSNIVPKFSRTPTSLDDAPDLGADTDQVLASLGYDQEARATLRERGTID